MTEFGELIRPGDALDEMDIREQVRRALAEDLPTGIDVTSVATIPNHHRATIDFVSRRPGVIAGLPVAWVVFDEVSRGSADVTSTIVDGVVVDVGDVVLSVTGSTRDLLTAERTALNFLGHLSGIATATREWVQELQGTTARVRDTRKTTPGLRQLEKYAVRCGGGINHRMSLSDAALVKDNHVAAAGGVTQAFQRVRAEFPDIDLEVEVDSIDQLRDVIEAGADLVLLDNFTPTMMREAVAIAGGVVKLEASGGLTLAQAHEVGATGVDYIAVGALTHSAPVLDIGADYREVVA